MTTPCSESHLSARHPFGGARDALGEFVPRHLRKEFLAEALLRESLVEDHRPQKREGAQGRTNRALVLPHLLFERGRRPCVPSSS